MLRRQTYCFQLLPNAAQDRDMRRFAGCARFVFNIALEAQNRERARCGRKLSGYAATW